MPKSTAAERRETGRLFAEAAARGRESDLIGVLVDGAGSAPGHHTWDYWDDHVREAIAQHARVLGVERVDR